MIIFIQKIWKIFWSHSLFRFLFVGGINTLFGVGIYTLLIWLGLNYQAAVLIGTVIAVLFNFKTIGGFVFKNKSNRLIFQFIMVYVVVYFLNINGIKLFISLGFSPLISGYFCVLPAALLSFVLNRLFVYRKNGIQHRGEK